MKTDEIIKKYEALSHDQRIHLPKSKIVTKNSLPDELVDYYCLWCITVGCTENIVQLEEIENIEEESYYTAQQFIYSTESRDYIKDEERKILIEWIEKHIVKKSYWEAKDSSLPGDFSYSYAYGMDICRSALVTPLFIYSPEQLKALRYVNELLG